MLEHLNSDPGPPKRAVVIGVGGFVGGAIGAELAARGVDVLGLTRAEIDLLADGAAGRLVEFLRPNDSIVFVSAIAPAKTVEQMMLNLKMAEAACAAFETVPPSHLLYISSDAVYADDANPVIEGSYAAPSTTHGMMHAARELMLKTSVACPFAALRPTLIYGAADPHGGYGPNRFRRQAAAGEPITLFGEGEERRDHVDVADVARLAALMLFHRSRGALNAVTGVSTSFHDIAHMVAAQFSPAAEIASVPRPRPRPHLLHRFFDITECLKAFPEFKYTSLEDGIRRVHQTIMETS